MGTGCGGAPYTSLTLPLFDLALSLPLPYPPCLALAQRHTQSFNNSWASSSVLAVVTILISIPHFGHFVVDFWENELFLIPNE